jgi:hypothetical protein
LCITSSETTKINKTNQIILMDKLAFELHGEDNIALFDETGKLFLMDFAVNYLKKAHANSQLALAWQETLGETYFSKNSKVRS